MDLPAAAPFSLSSCLVTQAALEHRTLFRNDRDRFVYLALARKAARRFEWRISGYCLLPDRTHLLLSAPSAEALDSGIRWMRRSFSSYLREDRGDRRRLWHSGYGVYEAEGAALWHTLACIEMEPVRTGLTAGVEEYTWSSAPAHLGSAKPYLPLDDTAWRTEFGPQRWHDYVRQCPGDFEYWHIVRRVAGGDFTPLGNAQRVSQISPALFEPGALQTRLGFGD